MKILYQLEKVEYFGYDPEDDENIEERIVLGHFSSLEKLTEAIEICLQNGINQKNIFISSFFDSFAPNQKYVYVLSHQYSLIDGEQYIDYEYIFPPLSNKKKCLALKEKLKNDPKYAFHEERCYDLDPPDGFCISKSKIDCLYGVILKQR